MLVGSKVMCKSHLDVIDVSTWCHIMFFVAKILCTLCDLSKVTRGIYNCMHHLWLKDSWKNQSLICKFLVVKVDGKLFKMGQKQGGRSNTQTLDFDNFRGSHNNNNHAIFKWIWYYGLMFHDSWWFLLKLNDTKK
jgi:hypothetical protein